jgi:hypothetical protein
MVSAILLYSQTGLAAIRQMPSSPTTNDKMTSSVDDKPRKGFICFARRSVNHLGSDKPNFAAIVTRLATSDRALSSAPSDSRRSVTS